MKLIADVNISQHVVQHLRQVGVDVVRVPELLDARAPDHEIVAHAARLEATIVSHDQDFSALLAVSGATQPSLINIRVSYVDAKRLAASIQAVLREAETDLKRGSIITIDDLGVRIHQLPVG